MQHVDDELTMAEMQFYLKLANGDELPVNNKSGEVVYRLRQKIGDESVVAGGGVYKLGEVPSDLIINLRGGLIGRRKE